MDRTYWKLIGTAMLWASTFHVGKFALASTSPIVIAAWRYGFSALILLAIAWPEIRGNWTRIREQWFILLVLALSGIVGFALSLFYGLSQTSPVNASLIVAFNPSMILLGSTLINRERTSLQQIAGLLLGLAGVMIVITHGSLDALLSLSLARGDLLIILATLFWTAYCVLPKRYVRDLSSMQLSSTTIIAAAIMLIGFAAGTTPQIAQLPDVMVICALLFMAVFGTVLPYLWWNQATQKIGPAKTGVFMNLVPIFASLMNVLMGKSLLGSQLLGAVFVIAGVLITSVKFGQAVKQQRLIAS